MLAVSTHATSRAPPDVPHLLAEHELGNPRPPAYSYEFIYPEQYRYMLELKRALDARGHCVLEVRACLPTWMLECTALCAGGVLWLTCVPMSACVTACHAGSDVMVCLAISLAIAIATGDTAVIVVPAAAAAAAAA
eukprot:519838-Pelagomonas_calceolata.AAC.4